MPLLFDATGLQIQGQAEIMSELAAAVKDPAVLGPSARPEDPSTNIGQFLNIFAEREARIQQLLVSLLGATDIDTAAGYTLDIVGQLNGVKRGGALPSTAAGSFTVDGSFTDPLAANSQVRNDRTNDVWQVLTAQPASGGTVQVTFQSLVAGPKEFLGTDSWTLLSAQAGVTGFSTAGNINPDDLGRDQESDADFRASIRNARLSDGNDVDAMIASAKQVPGVTFVGGFSNRTDSAVNGVPARATELVVDGGDVAAVAAAIYSSLPPGAETFGTESAQVPLPDGSTLEVFFSRPTDVQVWLHIELTLGAEYPASVSLESAVQAAVFASAERDTDPGVDVIPAAYQQQVWNATDNADGRPTLVNVQIQYSLDGSTLQSGRLELDHKQRADFDPARILVTTA